MESASKFQRILIINAINCSCHCAGQFQVAKADGNNDKGDEKRGEEGNEESGEERNKNGREKRRSEESNEERDEGQEQDVIEEIISPASYVNQFFFVKRINENGHSRSVGSKSRRRDDSEDYRPPDDDGMQFFRRILVIRMDNIPVCQPDI